MAPRAKSNTPSITSRKNSPTRRPATNSSAAPRLNPRFAQRGARFSSNSLMVFRLPTALYWETGTEHGVEPYRRRTRPLAKGPLLGIYFNAERRRSQIVPEQDIR